MNIGITYNLKSESYNIQPEHLLVDDTFEEFDTEETIDAIADVLEKDGHSIVKLGWGKDAIRRLISCEIDFVFNISEGYWGRNREAHIPAVLEMLDIPYSGSDPLTLSLALDKVMAKRLLQQCNIKTPDYYVIKELSDIKIAASRLRYPLFVKPAWEGSSKGIRYNSKVNKDEDLAACAEHILKSYHNQPVLVEEYISGQEFTIGVLGNEKPYVLGIMQILPSAPHSEGFFYSREVKRDWRNMAVYECPPKIDDFLMKGLQRSALEAFKVFGCRDISRIDVRVDNFGSIYFLEINPLPGLSPEYADMVIMARKMGWTYQRLVAAIFNHALSRADIEKAAVNEKI